MNKITVVGLLKPTLFLAQRLNSCVIKSNLVTYGQNTLRLVPKVGYLRQVVKVGDYDVDLFTLVALKRDVLRPLASAFQNCCARNMLL